MKSSTLLIVVLVLVILMVHKPKKTTAQITSGGTALIKLGETVVDTALGTPDRK